MAGETHRVEGQRQTAARPNAPRSSQRVITSLLLGFAMLTGLFAGPLASPSAAIVGGSTAADEQFGWVAGISASGAFDPECGGALVTATSVVTAAHCVTTGADAVTPSSIQVGIGREDLRTFDGTMHAVRRISVHPSYNPSTFENDIAVVELATASQTRPVQLADPDRRDLSSPGPAIVAGWGCTEADRPRGDCGLSYELRYGSEDIHAAEHCAAAGSTYSTYFDAQTQLCGDDLSGNSRSCFGDSGGPLTVNDAGQTFLVGVVSWSGSNCSLSTPVVYSSTQAHAEWLASVDPDQSMFRPTATARPIGTACPTSEVPEDGIVDVPVGSTHEFAVDCVLWWGISSGTAPGIYEPNAAVTRGQIATFMARVLTSAGVALPASDRDYFVDDNATAHEANINALRHLGLISGTSAVAFSPSASVSRAQMATFMRRVYEYAAGRSLETTDDYFNDDSGSTHEDSINAVAAVGYTAGGPSGGFSPTAPVTRAAMASFLTRMLDHLSESNTAKMARP